MAYARLSERLEEIIEELGEQRKLTPTLGGLPPEARAGPPAVIIAKTAQCCA
jgi:hypothetical protein